MVDMTWPSYQRFMKYIFIIPTLTEPQRGIVCARPLCEKILRDYVHIIILHTYMNTLHVYMIILQAYMIILHVYIIKYTRKHNYLACIHNHLYMYT